MGRRASMWATRRRRMAAILAGLGALFACLFFRLGAVQVASYSRFAAGAIRQRTQQLALGVPRGQVLDRRMRPLTGTYRRPVVAVFPALLPDLDRSLEKLGRVLNRSGEKLALLPRGGSEPVRLDVGGDPEAARAVAVLDIPGVLVLEEDARYGPSGIAPHVVGYVNAADNRGVAGIEAKFDAFLRGGQPSFLTATVDGMGGLIPGLGFRRRSSGRQMLPCDVVLTIDAEVQSFVEEVMRKDVERGTVVVVDIATGDVLAMASSPRFSPERLGDYLREPRGALVNRAVAAYTPGSVFKLIVICGALEEGLVSPSERFVCRGEVAVGNRRFRCHAYDRGGHGEIGLEEAVAYSCNAVFLEIGRRLGAAQIVEYARRFGLGAKTGVGVPEEVGGEIPSPEALGLGDVANLAIGQGPLTVTPLQMASVAATLANRGTRIVPRLVQQVIRGDGIVVEQFRPAKPVRVVSAETAQAVCRMLEAVTAYGTGKSAQVPGVGSAGKTGTAQTATRGLQTDGPTHAWFVGYVPARFPRYAVAVFVEEGGYGGQAAAPVFARVGSELAGKR